MARRTGLQLIAGMTASVCWPRPPSVVAHDKSRPARETFPTQPGKYIAGELVYIDAVNRRAGLRLDGDQNRYFTGPPHWFALLPYAPVWHLGARAELRDLPLGTHVHGYFAPPPPGEEATIPSLPDDKKQFAIAENHATLLEDDFSFYQRRQRAWRVASLDLVKEKIHLEPVMAQGRSSDSQRTTKGQQATGTEKGAAEGIQQPFTFDIDARSEIWQARRRTELSSIKPGTIVQFNLGWAHGWGQFEFRVAHLWLDDESRKEATDRQRQRHLQYERERWTAGWIEEVEHFDYGGGIVTLTLFDVDPEILDDLWQDREERIAVAVAERTRRTWFHRSDRKFAKLVAWNKSDSPPLGSSGVQLKLKFTELLAGYLPGACVRVKAERWKFVSMPPEERITSADDRQRGSRMVLPW